MWHGVPDCYSATYEHAVEICVENGLHLCTHEELLTDMCCAKGCSFDEVAVWTSSYALYGMPENVDDKNVPIYQSEGCTLILSSTLGDSGQELGGTSGNIDGMQYGIALSNTEYIIGVKASGLSSYGSILKITTSEGETQTFDDIVIDRYEGFDNG
eukprot:UN23732